MAGEPSGLSEEESPARALSGQESSAPLSGTESQAPARSRSESQAPALSQWLQLMLAEITAKREAHERARAEEALRSAEHGARAEPAAAHHELKSNAPRLCLRR